MADVAGTNWQLYYPEDRTPRRVDTDDLTVYVFGRPLLEGSLRDAITDAASLSRLAARLDGEYVLVVDRSDGVAIVTDRYGSQPFFYATVDERLLLSTSYLRLWRSLKEHDALVVDDDAFYEFAYFQRLFGRDTYDRRSRAAPSASVIEWDGAGQPTASRYWRPIVKKANRSLDAWADRIASAIEQAVQRRIDEGAELGILLSGGLDSRAILGAFPDETTPTCYTLGERRNNEVEVAEQLAAVAGAEHVFLERDEDYYENFLERAVRVGGGMYTFDHAHFFTVADRVDVDVLFHGHGLDYLFQGMYLPTRRPSVLGHPTYFERLRGIDNIVGTYTDEISYRLDDGSASRMAPDDRRRQLESRLQDTLEGVLAAAPDDLPEVYDGWDFLHVDDQFRHYTHLNVLSISDGVAQYTAAFDHDILSLFWSMPAKVRADASAYKHAISRLNPDLLGVRDANTNLPVEPSPAKLTAIAAYHALSRRVPFLPQTHSYPDPGDRSWPDRDAIVRNNDGLRSRAESLNDADRIGRLESFDPDSIGRLVDDHLDGREDFGAGILTLITVDEFLRQGGLPD